MPERSDAPRRPPPTQRVYAVAFALTQGEPGHIAHEIVVSAERQMLASAGGVPVALDRKLEVWRDGEKLPTTSLNVSSTEDGRVTVPASDARIREALWSLVAHVAIGPMGDLLTSGTTWHRQGALLNGFAFDLEQRVGVARAMESGAVAVPLQIRGTASNGVDRASAVGEVLTNAHDPTQREGWVHSWIEPSGDCPSGPPRLQQRVSFIVAPLLVRGSPRRVLERMRYRAAQLELDPLSTSAATQAPACQDQDFYRKLDASLATGEDWILSFVVTRAGPSRDLPVPGPAGLPLAQRVWNALTPKSSELARCFSEKFSGAVVYDLAVAKPRAQHLTIFDGDGTPVEATIPASATSCAGRILATNLSLADRRELGRLMLAVNAPRPSAADSRVHKDEIGAAIRAQLPEVRACYTGALAGWPGLSGRITVRLLISKEGEVKVAKPIESTLDNPALEACIARAARAWRFQPSRSPGVTIVSFPFVLTPEEITASDPL